MPDISYIIAATPRSGSNLLCEALRGTRLAGRPDEFFLYWFIAATDPERLREEYVTKWRIPDDECLRGLFSRFTSPDEEFVTKWRIPDEDYLRKVFEEGTTPNGVFGVKIMWDYFEVVIEKLRRLPRLRGLGAPEVLDAVFPGLRYIHMVRADKVRQAVSLARAIESLKWYSIRPRRSGLKRLYSGVLDRLKARPGTSSGDAPVYDFDRINGIHRMLIAHDAAWEAFFKELGLSPFRVVYEDFSKAYEETAVDILGYLDIPLPEKVTFARRSLTKQGDAVNEEWARRFAEDMSARSL
jgi:LPS sulfotransferase NodH